MVVKFAKKSRSDWHFWGHLQKVREKGTPSSCRGKSRIFCRGPQLRI